MYTRNKSSSYRGTASRIGLSVVSVFFPFLAGCSNNTKETQKQNSQVAVVQSNGRSIDEYFSNEYNSTNLLDNLTKQEKSLLEYRELPTIEGDLELFIKNKIPYLNLESPTDRDLVFFKRNLPEIIFYQLYEHMGSLSLDENDKKIIASLREQYEKGEFKLGNNNLDNLLRLYVNEKNMSDQDLLFTHTMRLIYGNGPSPDQFYNIKIDLPFWPGLKLDFFSLAKTPYRTTK